jgi:hypothetical protein
VFGGVMVGMLAASAVDHGLYKVLTDEKKKKPPFLVLKYLYIQAAWTKFDTFHFQIFCPN